MSQPSAPLLFPDSFFFKPTIRSRYRYAHSLKSGFTHSSFSAPPPFFSPLIHSPDRRRMKDVDVEEVGAIVLGWSRLQRNCRCIRAANRTIFQFGLCSAAAGGDPAAGAGRGRLAVLLCECSSIHVGCVPPVILLPDSVTDSKLHIGAQLLRDTTRPVRRQHTNANLLCAPGAGL